MPEYQESQIGSHTSGAGPGQQISVFSGGKENQEYIGGEKNQGAAQIPGGHKDQNVSRGNRAAEGHIFKGGILPEYGGHAEQEQDFHKFRGLEGDSSQGKEQLGAMRHLP